MKKLLKGAIITMLCVTGCINHNQKDELDGVEVRIDNIETKELKNGNTVIQLHSTITNNSDRHISSVLYYLTCFTDRACFKKQMCSCQVVDTFVFK